MKRLILMSFLLLALVCWQTSAVEKTKVNQVKSKMPGETVGTVGTVGTIAVVASTASDSQWLYASLDTGKNKIQYDATIVEDHILLAQNLPPVPLIDKNENPPAITNDVNPVPINTDTGKKGFWDLLGGYWAELLLGTMGVIKILVRITPTLKDDKVFGWLDKLIEMLIPNITSKKNG